MKEKKKKLLFSYIAKAISRKLGFGGVWGFGGGGRNNF